MSSNCSSFYALPYQSVTANVATRLCCRWSALEAAVYNRNLAGRMSPSQFEELLCTARAVKAARDGFYRDLCWLCCFTGVCTACVVLIGFCVCVGRPRPSLLELTTYITSLNREVKLQGVTVTHMSSSEHVERHLLFVIDTDFPVLLK